MNYIIQQIGCCPCVTQIAYTSQWILQNVSFRKQKGARYLFILALVI